jgi:hypothetical protein
VGGAIGGDQRVLNGVSGLLAVAQRPQGHGPETIAMPPHKLTEGVRIALYVPGEEILIACVAVCVVICHRTPSPAMWCLVSR